MTYSKGLFILLFTFSFSSSALGQAKTMDNILDELAAISNDSLRIMHCQKSSFASDYETGKLYIQKGLDLCIKNKNHFQHGRMYIYAGILEDRKAAHQQSLILYTKADSIYRSVNNTTRVAATQTNIGNSYSYMGDYDKALVHYFNAHKIYNKNGEPNKAYSSLLNNLAACLRLTGQNDQAEKYYQESFRIKEVLKDSVGMANTKYNLALLYNDEKDYDKALSTLLDAQNMFNQIGKREEEVSCQLIAGKVLADQGKSEAALPYLLLSLNEFRGRPNYVSEYLMAASEVCFIYMDDGKYREADRIITESLETVKMTDKKNDLKEILGLKAAIDYELGNYQSAFMALDESNIVRDSLQEVARMELTKEMETRFSLASKEKELALSQLALESQKRTSQLYRAAMIATSVILGIIAVFGYFLFRARKKLQEKNGIIEQSLHDKEFLLKEIHHRVKNNLQVITSLLNLQSNRITDPTALDAVREGKDRVRAMALIHQGLYQDVNLVAVESSDYIEKLTQSLFHSYNVDPDRISMDTDIDFMKLDVDIMIPIGLILNELITNALKYGFNDGRQGLIQIALKKREENIELLVKDNGVGLPDDLDIDQSKSMGLLIIKNFCRKLKAKYKFYNDNGTVVRISFPTPVQ